MNLSMRFSPQSRSRRVTGGFTLMEILVTVAIVLVLAALAFPVYTSIQIRSHKAVALNNIKQLGTALGSFTAENDGWLPDEDSKGSDTWEDAAKPESGKAWYNALPRLLGQKGVGDYAKSPRDFYTKANLLFLPAAPYPDSDRKLAKPLFAIAFNTKLHRKDEGGIKGGLKTAMITHPSRTVLFLEQGLPGEEKGAPIQSKKDYDGSPKGSAKSMAGRYNGSGVLGFADGHTEVLPVKDVLTETGRFPFPQTDIVWTRTPDEDPNK